MTDVEQRERERSRVWLPIRLRTDAGEVLAVTYDASDKGVLLLTARPLQVGAAVTLTFELPGPPLEEGAVVTRPSNPKAASEPLHERTATGRVVRAGPNEQDPNGLWPHRIAVVFDQLVDGLGNEIEALARVHPLVARAV